MYLNDGAESLVLPAARSIDSEKKMEQNQGQCAETPATLVCGIKKRS